MRPNPHAAAAHAYLEELCHMLRTQRRIRRPRTDWWTPPLVLPAAVGFALASCGGSVVGNGENVGPVELCNDLLDNDGDGRTDCADPDCPPCDVPVYSAPPDGGAVDVSPLPPDGAGHDGDKPPPDVHPPAEVCSDGVDNDLDGLVDCLDPDCADACKCAAQEDCTNNVDDDCDNLIDCDDSDCAAVQCCIATAYGGPFWGELCFNGVDDDCDGFTDCEDADCVAAACCSMADYAAPQPGPENCGIPDDEDCDGLIDCADPDCASVCGGDAYAAPQK